MRSCDLAFLWPKLSQPQFYKDLTIKTTFFEGWSCLKFNNLGVVLGRNFKFYSSVAKWLKSERLGANWYICRNYRGKPGGWWGGGGFVPSPPSWIGLRTMHPLAKPRYGSNQATKINLFVRIVDAFKLMSWMFEGLWLHLWLVLKNAINWMFSSQWVDKAILTPSDVRASKYYKNADVRDSILNSL